MQAMPNSIYDLNLIYNRYALFSTISQNLVYAFSQEFVCSGSSIGIEKIIQKHKERYLML